MSEITVERSIWIDAPRQRVWQAVTEPEQIGQWFLPKSLGMPMKPGANGRIVVGMGPMEIDVAVFEDVDAPRKATTRSLPDRQLATTYTLDEEKGGTKLTVTMTGFEGLPEDSRHDRLNVSGSAWEQTLENLKAYVTGAEAPYPFSGVSPLFGYWRDTKKQVAVERSIWIKATRERVWEAITDPDQVAKWFSPGSVFKSTGSEVGSRLYVENPENGEEMYVQILEVVEPPRHLVTRSQAEPPEPSFATSYRLDEENGGTRLTLTFTGYEGMADDQRYPMMEQNTFGFGMMLDNLRAYVEGEPLPVPGGF